MQMFTRTDGTPSLVFIGTIYWYVEVHTNIIIRLFLTRITSWIHALYLGDLHSEKAFVQALDITNFFLFV